MIRGKRVLLLGSTGLIGSKLLSILSKNNTVFPTYHKKLIPNGYNLDITSRHNLETVFNASKPDIVINMCAIYKNLSFCEENKELIMAINGDSVKDIAELSNQYNAYLVHFSSDYVFDGIKGDYKETDKPNPINFFGKTKLNGERNVQNHSQKFCIVRTSMVYGPSTSSLTLPDWIIEQSQKHEHIELIYDQFMTPTYLENLCEMLLELLQIKFDGIIHLAGANRLSRYEFAKEIINLLQMKTKLRKISTRDFDKNNLRPKDSSLNTDLASQILQTKPENFQLSIKKYLSSKKIL